MAKSVEKNEALFLRKNGKSIKEIAQKVGVSKSSVSLWCRDIVLTKKQIGKLQASMRRGSYIGRMKGARTQYQRRIRLTENLETTGRTMLGGVSERDMFMMGVGLYWGEGTKFGRQVSLANSNPAIIKFSIGWFREVWGVTNDRFKFYIFINEIHKNRINEVEQFWRKVVDVSNPHFGKTILIKAKNKKKYANFSTHFGTLQVRVARPNEIHQKIMGILHTFEK
ncbi:MAG: hypothetical protein Q8Q38_02400 [bacterium]|nr:hypothetical protein [bacterium]